MKARIALAVLAALVVPVALHAQMKMQMLTEKEQVTALQKAIANGKKHFNDPKLGGATTGASCNSCHPGGGTSGGSVTVMGMRMAIPDVRSSAATFPKWKMGAQRVITLGEMNNGCIEMFMKGKALRLDDPKYAELAAYETSLAQGKALYPQLPK